MEDLFGLSLRDQLAPDLLEDSSFIHHFEAISETLLHNRGPAWEAALALREHKPMVLHGLSLDICGAQPLDERYIAGVADLCEVFEPLFISDHLCWTRLMGRHTYDLLPAPFTEAMVEHTVRRIDRVQTALRRPLVLENISSYVRFRHDALDEATFTHAVLERSGAQLLLDVNNLYVNSFNHGFPWRDLLNIAPAKVAGYHLGGHTDRGTVLFDTHDQPVTTAVLDIFGEAWRRIGPRVCTLEWDDPAASAVTLQTELQHIRQSVAPVATVR